MENSGESHVTFWTQGLERPNPPHTPTGTGGVGDCSSIYKNRLWDPIIFHVWKIGVNPWQKFNRQVHCTPRPPVGRTCTGTPSRLLPLHMDRSRGRGTLEMFWPHPSQDIPQGCTLGTFWATGVLVPILNCTGGRVDTLLVHSQPPTHLALLLCHPPLTPPRKAS